MGLGIITGREIIKNLDGDKERIILQVELVPDSESPDVRPVELISQAGEDTNPATGCRVLVLEADKSYSVGIAVTDDLQPEVEPGEKEIYSTDSPATQKLARLKWNSSGQLELNGNTDFAVRYKELEKVVDELQAQIDKLRTGIASWVPVASDGGAALKLALGPLPTGNEWLTDTFLEDIESSKVENVLLPEAP